jgi:hypothetical protein
MSRFAPFVKGFMQGMGIAQERELYNRKIEELDRVRSQRKEMEAIYSDDSRYAIPEQTYNVGKEGTRQTETYKPAPEMQMAPGGALGTMAAPGQSLRGIETEKTFTPETITRPAGFDHSRRMLDVSRVAGKYGDPATAMQWQIAAEAEPARQLARQATEAHRALLAGDYEGTAARLSQLYDRIPDGQVANVKFNGQGFDADIYDQKTGKLLRTQQFSLDETAQRLYAMTDPKHASELAQKGIENQLKRDENDIKREEIAAKYGPEWDVKFYGQDNNKVMAVDKKTGKIILMDSGDTANMSKEDAARLGNVSGQVLKVMGVDSLEGLTDDNRKLAMEGTYYGQKLYRLNRNLAGKPEDVDGAYAKMGMFFAKARSIQDGAERIKFAQSEGFAVQNVNGKPEIIYRREGSPFEYVQLDGKEYIVNQLSGVSAPAAIQGDVTIGAPQTQGAVPKPGMQDPKKPANSGAGMRKPKTDAKYYSMGPDGKLVPDDQNGIYTRSGTSHTIDRGRVIQTDPAVRAFDAAIKDAAAKGLPTAELVKKREEAAKRAAKAKGLADGGLVRDAGRGTVYTRQGQKKGANPVEVFRKRPMANAPVGQVPVAAGGGTAKDRYGRPITALGRVGGMPARAQPGAPMQEGPTSGRKAEAQQAIVVPFHPAQLPQGTPLGEDVVVRPYVPDRLPAGIYEGPMEGPRPWTVTNGEPGGVEPWGGAGYNGMTSGIGSPSVSWEMDGRQGSTAQGAWEHWNDPGMSEADLMQRSYGDQDVVWDMASRQRPAIRFE